MREYTDSDAMLGVAALVIGLGLLVLCAVAAIVARVCEESNVYTQARA